MRDDIETEFCGNLLECFGAVAVISDSGDLTVLFFYPPDFFEDLARFDFSEV